MTRDDWVAQARALVGTRTDRRRRTSDQRAPQEGERAGCRERDEPTVEYMHAPILAGWVIAAGADAGGAWRCWSWSGNYALTAGRRDGGDAVVCASAWCLWHALGWSERCGPAASRRATRRHRRLRPVYRGRTRAPMAAPRPAPADGSARLRPRLPRLRAPRQARRRWPPRATARPTI